MLFKKNPKKTASVGKHFVLTEKEIAQYVASLNRIIGQIETIKSDITSGSACDETLTQILAIKGGVESVGRNLVGKGILDCLDKYSREDLELVIKNLFKLS